jgi:hypothetical protein
VQEIPNQHKFEAMSQLNLCEDSLEAERGTFLSIYECQIIKGEIEIKIQRCQTAILQNHFSQKLLHEGEERKKYQ